MAKALPPDDPLEVEQLFREMVDEGVTKLYFVCDGAAARAVAGRLVYRAGPRRVSVNRASGRVLVGRMVRSSAGIAVVETVHTRLEVGRDGKFNIRRVPIGQERASRG